MGSRIPCRKQSTATARALAGRCARRHVGRRPGRGRRPGAVFVGPAHGQGAPWDGGIVDQRPMRSSQAGPGTPVGLENPRRAGPGMRRAAGAAPNPPPGCRRPTRRRPRTARPGACPTPRALSHQSPTTASLVGVTGRGPAGPGGRVPSARSLSPLLVVRPAQPGLEESVPHLPLVERGELQREDDEDVVLRLGQADLEALGQEGPGGPAKNRCRSARSTTPPTIGPSGASRKGGRARSAPAGPVPRRGPRGRSPRPSPRPARPPRNTVRRMPAGDGRSPTGRPQRTGGPGRRRPARHRTARRLPPPGGPPGWS